jgi:uncharacterized protein YjbI with pentapeptide repeats
MAASGQVESDLQQAERKLEQVENDLQQVQAQWGPVKDKFGPGEAIFEQTKKEVFDQAEDDFQTVKRTLEQAEDESRKLGTNKPAQMVSELRQVKDRFRRLKDRRAKVIAKFGLEQVEDEPTVYDFMKFERFSKPIANIIINSFDQDTKSNTMQMTMGIYGDWGSGKTSFLKMIERDLLKANIHPIWFQAWRYHQEEELWSSLTQKILDDARVDGSWYRKISVKLRIWSNNNINWHDGLLEILRKVWRPVLSFIIAIVGGLIIYFSRNTSMAGSFSSIPYLLSLITALGGFVVAAGLVKPASELFKALRGNLGIDFEKFKQKPAYRQKVAFWDQFNKEFGTIVRLSGQGKPLVVIVDDLDRCLPEAALQVLEAIKNLLGVKGCIFLLGLDRKVVEKAVAVKYKDMFETQSGMGENSEEKALPLRRFFYEDYVDKIFQLSITLPKLSPDSMKGFIKGVTYDEDVRDCIEVFSTGLSPNPRRIKRVLRTFLFVRDIAVAEERVLSEEKGTAEEEKLSFRLFRLSKLIVMQSDFPIVFDAITENPSLLKDLEQYYRKSASDTTKPPGGRTGSTGMTGKGASTGTNGTDVVGKDAGGSDDMTITEPVDREGARTTKTGTDESRKAANGAKAETGETASNGTKTEADVGKKDTTLGGQAEKFAANYPKLPKVLITSRAISGQSSEEAFFSELDIAVIERDIALIGALAEVRPDREELRIASEKQQQALLQAYLDRIAELVKEGRSQKEVINEVQKQTESVLSRLDTVHKGLVLQSLYRLGLVNQIDWNQTDLVGADLSRANLSEVDLSGANLSGANLSGANLSGANLSGANLRLANLSGADLSGATLNRANIGGANIGGANLSEADLSRANLSRANLSEANLSRANLSDADFRMVILIMAILRMTILRGTNLSEADLSEADLSEADLSRANLSRANLSEANLGMANLSEANLGMANLTGTIVTLEQVEQAESLQGAMMPDGSRHA